MDMAIAISSAMAGAGLHFCHLPEDHIETSAERLPSITGWPSPDAHHLRYQFDAHIAVGVASAG